MEYGEGPLDADVVGLEHSGGWFRGIVSELHSGGLPLSVHSNVVEASRQVKTEPGLLFGFSVCTSRVTQQFIQVFDVASAPANGTVPAAVFLINQAASANGDALSVSYIFPGRFHRTGIWLANSTTLATLTAGSADCFFDVQYA